MRPPTRRIWPLISGVDGSGEPGAGRAVAGLLLASVIVGYFGILMVQTITYAARDFGAGLSEQGYALAAVRIDFFLALVIVTFADRLGRHRVLVACITLAALSTALTGLAGSIETYTTAQIVAKGLVSAAVVLIGIVTAEIASVDGRARLLGLVTVAASAGAGICVLLLGLADASVGAWRWFHVAALVTLPVPWLVARWVPEPRRFTERNRNVSLRGYWRPLLMLSAGAVLLTVFSTPTIELKNDWLRQARGYSGTDLTIYNVIAYGPALVGIFIGGYLAERIGRKPVAITGIAFAVVGGVASYWSHGWLVTGWSALSGAFTGLAIAPLLVYRPELFPTALRAKANGIIGGASRIGAVIGLLVAASLSSDVTELHRAIAVVAIGPLLLILLIGFVYPETRGRSLEDLHPVDARSPTEP